MLGLEAAKRKVKAYVRVTLPFYETTTKGSHDEKDDPKPEGTIGIWWHETLRMLAAIPECVIWDRLYVVFLPSWPICFSLNLVILRTGFVYGPYIEFGDSTFDGSMGIEFDWHEAYQVTSAITVGSVYGYLNKPMKSMYVYSLCFGSYVLKPILQLVAWQESDKYSTCRGSCWCLLGFCSMDGLVGAKRGRYIGWRGDRLPQWEEQGLASWGHATSRQKDNCTSFQSCDKHNPCLRDVVLTWISLRSMIRVVLFSVLDKLSHLSLARPLTSSISVNGHCTR